MELYQDFLFSAVLSVLLAFLLGKLFFIGDSVEADRVSEPTKITGERQGDDHLVPDPTDAIRRSPSEECEEEKGFGVDEVRSDEISAKGIHGGLEIERFDGDLVELEISEEIEVRVDYSENRFEASAELDNSVRVMPGFGENECLEEAKELKCGLEKELGVARIKSRFEMSEIRIGSPFVKEEELDGLKDNSIREIRELIESERLEEAKEFQFALTEPKVERADVFLVKEDECGEDAARLREKENVLKEGSGREKSRNDKKVQSLLSEEDEWEGIEQTELEKCFHEAAAYVGGEGGEFALSSLTDDEQMQLYGLHKVATEGPCYDPQPMALRVAARAKWHAWQRLGNMNPDAAMEQYMNLLSEKNPGWMREKPEGDVEKHAESEFTEAALPKTCSPDLCSHILCELSTESRRKQECPSCINEENDSATVGHTGQGFMRTK